MNILLDTCAFLWLTTDAAELSETAKMLFRDTGNRVYLSSVSVWEILVKHHLGKLPLPTDAKTFIERQCQLHLIETLPLDSKAVFCLSDLPNHHRDPFDRMLICQAIAHDLTILSADRVVIQYPVRTIW